MKLLVLAQIPPPLHGQSVMVRILVEGLPARQIALHHVNLGLSRGSTDIGRWRAGKIAALLDACIFAVAGRFRHRCDTLYYVPAPGKRGAFYRDCLVMLLCRPFFARLVLHWHAAGLHAWLENKATAFERYLARRLLGRADLAIVLADSLRQDAVAFSPQRIVCVPNGIDDPCPGGTQRSPSANRTFQVLFLGLGSEEKGLFATAEAVLAANRNVNATGRGNAFTLVAAGVFPDASTASRFRDLCEKNPALRHIGLVHGMDKDELLRSSHVLCLPTRYEPEGQPLVLLEAMAHDLPIIATRWRAIPGTVPPEAVLIDQGDAAALVPALLQVRSAPPPAGVFRRHYLAHFTTEQHLDALAATLRTL